MQSPDLSHGDYHAARPAPCGNSYRLARLSLLWNGNKHRPVVQVFPARLLRLRQPTQRNRRHKCLADKQLKSASHSPVFAPAGAGRVIAREHGAQHAPRIPREGVVFREPPDMAGRPVISAQRRVTSRNHSAGNEGNYLTIMGSGDSLRVA